VAIRQHFGINQNLGSTFFCVWNLGCMMNVLDSLNSAICLNCKILAMASGFYKINLILRLLWSDCNFKIRFDEE